MNELIAKLVTVLKEQAAERTVVDPDEYYTGNFDDTFYMGVSDGRTQLAQELLELLGVPYTKHPDNQGE